MLFYLFINFQYLLISFHLPGMHPFLIYGDKKFQKYDKHNTKIKLYIKPAIKELITKLMN